MRLCHDFLWWVFVSLFQLLKYKCIVRSSVYQIHSFSTRHSLQYPFGADCTTLPGRPPDLNRFHKEALTLFYFKQQIVSINQAAMFTHFVLKLCFNFVLGIILLSSQLSANPLNRFDLAVGRGTETTQANHT